MSKGGSSAHIRAHSYIVLNKVFVEDCCLLDEKVRHAKGGSEPTVDWEPLLKDGVLEQGLRRCGLKENDDGQRDQGVQVRTAGSVGRSGICVCF